MSLLSRAVLAVCAAGAALLVAAPALPFSAQAQRAPAPAGSPPAASRAKLAELNTLQDLKTAFNTGRGQIRIVLLLSPT